MNITHKHYKLVLFLSSLIFVVGSLVVLSVAKEGLTYSKASSIHAQSVLP